jgi:hypothetical protein
MTNKQYDILKDISLCWFTLVTAFIGVFITAWNLPYGEPILTTLAGLNTFMGGVVKYYKAKYDKEKNKTIEDCL